MFTTSAFVSVFMLSIAAVLEVGGDALIRRGLHGHSLLATALGFIVLGSYGIAVNLLQLDFSRLLGTYVAVFALAAVVFGRFVFDETIAPTTWLGLGLIGLGSLVIQFGPKLAPVLR